MSNRIQLHRQAMRLACVIAVMTWMQGCAVGTVVGGVVSVSTTVIETTVDVAGSAVKATGRVIGGAVNAVTESSGEKKNEKNGEKRNEKNGEKQDPD